MTVGCRAGTHHAALSTLHTRLRDLRDTLVSAILGTEEENGGPVVREVFGELATRAAGKLWEIMCLGVHRHVEGVLQAVSCSAHFGLKGVEIHTPPMI
jgi:hypothetical protein